MKIFRHSKISSTDSMDNSTIGLVYCKNLYILLGLRPCLGGQDSTSPLVKISNCKILLMIHLYKKRCTIEMSYSTLYSRLTWADLSPTPPESPIVSSELSSHITRTNKAIDGRPRFISSEVSSILRHGADCTQKTIRSTME